MSIFITGGSGFIGYYFHRRMAQDNIVNFDMIPPGFEYSSEHVAGDVRILEQIDAAVAKHRCSSIISLAAEHKDFGVSSESYFATNVEGTRNICNVAEKHGIQQILYFSSVAVYGGKCGATEETLPMPRTPYGASKLAGEEVLRSWTTEDNNRSVVVLRPTVVYGARNLANMLRLIRQIDRNLYFNVGKADNIKSIAYVENVVDAALYLLERMEPGFHVFNYVDKPDLTIREISEFIAKNLGKKRPRSLPLWLLRAMALPFDWSIELTGRDLPISTSRLTKVCTSSTYSAEKIFEQGFRPKWSITEGLNQMLLWYHEQEQVGALSLSSTGSAG